ncbi:MAG: GTP cyclohydrolase II RibA [Patescibacteria group bacterium]
MTIVASTILITEYGRFNVSYHKTKNGEGLSIKKGKLNTTNPLLRIQSSCIFSESFHSTTCDCSLQLQGSLKIINEFGNGALVYLFDEGRGAGLLTKIKAMEIERQNEIDTVEAFKKLGLPADLRNYKIALDILEDIEINKELKLITNNPNKKKSLEENGYKVTEIVRLNLELNDSVRKYLKMKKEKLGHEYIDLE